LTLQQINIIKHQTELLNFEPEIDDLEMYTRDAPLNIEEDGAVSLSDSLPTIEGSEQLQQQLRELCAEFKGIFSTEVKLSQQIFHLSKSKLMS